SWAYPTMFSVWRQGLLNITPTVNLVDNNGFGMDAAHAGPDKPAVLQANPPRAMKFPLKHPAEVKLNSTADTILDRYVYEVSVRRSLKYAFKRRLRQIGLINRSHQRRSPGQVGGKD